MEEKKLKTLKEIEADAQIHWEGNYKDNKYVKRIVVSDKLRSVAREWIKELQDENEIFISDGKIGKYDKDTFIYYNQEARDRFLNNIAKIDWIKHFFNLEE